jgi:hypothetical protein
MSVLEKIAYYQNRRDEVPNQELARELAQAKDAAGIREIAENLWNKEPNVQSDCLKVLYEIGYLDPSLVANYAGDFLKLTRSKNNRLVWGAMIALSTIAAFKADEIFPHVSEIQMVMDKGSVITKDNGVRILALVASKSDTFSREIFPYLLHHLETCRPKDVPQHSEKTLVAVNAGNRQSFIAVLNKRIPDLRASELARVKKVIKKAESL